LVERVEFGPDGGVEDVAVGDDGAGPGDVVLGEAADFEAWRGCHCGGVLGVQEIQIRSGGVMELGGGENWYEMVLVLYRLDGRRSFKIFGISDFSVELNTYIHERWCRVDILIGKVIPLLVRRGNMSKNFFPQSQREIGEVMGVCFEWPMGSVQIRRYR
jgi:hypothetical protein